jgi:hypothetical protein
VIDGVFAGGEDGQIHVAEAARLSSADIAALQLQARARLLWFHHQLAAQWSVP